MALGLNDVRSIVLRIVAVDEASGTLDRVGNNLAGISKSFKMFGAGIAFQQIGQRLTTIGEAMLGVSKSAIEMAASFEKGIALVQTQAQLGSDQLMHLSNNALNAAGKYGQGFETINQGLYDIFSSTEATGRQALRMVNKYAEAATAGGTDVRTVTRAAIATQNAYGYSTAKTSMILDNQFQAVRKGVFTYEEFTSAIGNLLPYGRSADQTLADITGAMSFMSRNGFTASQSAISVARALDQLTRHRADIKKTLGVDIVDTATGKYKDLGTIMAEFNQKLSGMTNPQIQNALQNIFGAGEIRANRFFKLAIPQQQNLNDLVKQMGGKAVSGQLGKAWDIMKQTPAVQWQILIERGRALLVMFGEALLPALTAFAKALINVFKWIRDLSPETKKWIAIIFTVAGVIITLTGLIFTFIGGLLLIGSALTFTGVGIGAFAATAGIIAGIVAALVIAAVLVWRNWDKVKPILMSIWNGLKTTFITVWNAIAAVASAIAGWVWKFIIQPFIQLQVFLFNVWKTIFQTIYNVIMAIWNFIQPFVMGLAQLWVAEITIIWNVVSFAFNLIWNIIKGVMGAILVVIKGVWALVAGVTKAWWAVVWAIIKTYVQIMWKTIVEFTKLLIAGWKALWTLLKMFWNTIGRPVFQAIVSFVKGALWPPIKTFLNLMAQEWKFLWGIIKAVWNTVGKPVFDAVKTVFKAVWDFLVGAFDAIKTHWAGFWAAVKSIFFGIINGILGGIESFVNGIIDAINWVRSKFGLDQMGHVTLGRVGTSGGGSTNTGTGVTGQGRGAAGLAKGTSYWGGGWAVVGEKGPEMAFLPRGAAVIPNQFTRAMATNGVPGFAGGLLSSEVVKRALSAVGVHMPSFPGVFDSIGQGIYTQVLEWFKGAIHYILGGPNAHTGGAVTQTGWAYLQQGEQVQSARIARDYWRGGGASVIHLHVEPQKANIDPIDMVNELDWYMRMH